MIFDGLASKLSENKTVDLRDDAAISTLPELHSAKDADALELNIYEKYVEEMAKRADSTMIMNHSEKHAEVILAQLFKSADSNVKIVTGCLRDSVYGSTRVMSAVKGFLARQPNARVLILHELEISSDNRLLNLLESAGLGARFQMVRLRKTVEAHFAVADEQHFRLELDDEKGEAIVFFGHKEAGSRLSAICDKLFGKNVRLAA